MSSNPPEVRFHTNLLEFCYVIKDIVEEATSKKVHCNIDPNLIDIARGFLRSCNPKETITNFIERSSPHWESIRQRNKDIILKHSNIIFNGLPKDYIDSFSRLFELNDSTGNPVISEDSQNMIWEFIESLVKISIHFIHEQRHPVPKDGGFTYTREAFPGIKVKVLASEWGIKNLKVPQPVAM